MCKLYLCQIPSPHILIQLKTHIIFSTIIYQLDHSLVSKVYNILSSRSLLLIPMFNHVVICPVSAASPACSLLHSSPAPSRRISTASLFRSDSAEQPTPSSDSSKPLPREKRLPIINPLVRLPMWPSKLILFLQRNLGFYFKTYFMN